MQDGDRLSRVLRTNPCRLVSILPDGTITQANRALLELFGVESDDDLTGYDAPHFYVDVADRDHLADLLKDNDVVVGFEARMRRVDGQVIWVRDTSRRIETENGVIFEGAMVDITSQRAIEE
ncbi:MAG: PAS domain-containing protein, partial [Candidatus Hydrogenedentes bacterium]|nr:PAS domain-containing protein [Candidatus Hydrogenedentota bacterium]